MEPESALEVLPVPLQELQDLVSLASLGLPVWLGPQGLLRLELLRLAQVPLVYRSQPVLESFPQVYRLRLVQKPDQLRGS